MIYGIAKTMIPPNTINSIIGFENMAVRLNDSGGMK